MARDGSMCTENLKAKYQRVLSWNNTEQLHRLDKLNTEALHSAETAAW